MLAGLAAACSGGASAGMFATEVAVPDFTFEKGQIVYSLPSAAELLRGLSAENVLGQSTAGGISADDPGRFSARLTADASPDASQWSGSNGVMVFGSIPAAEDTSTVDLMKGILDSMQIDGGDDSLSFLVSGRSATGVLANEFRSFGLYSVVLGLDPVDWLAQHSSAGSLSNLTLSQLDSEAAAEAAGRNSAIPLPSTPLLILAGLLSLRLVTRNRL